MTNKVIKLKDIVEVEEALGELLSVKLPAPLSYRLSKLSAPLIAELKLFGEARNQLLQELGTPVEGQNGNFNIAADKVAEFTGSLADILATEVPLEKFEGIDIAKLEKVELSTKSMIQLVEFGIIVDLTEPKKPIANDFDDDIPF